MLRQAGFTLIELMITVAVAAVLASVAVPGLRDYVQSSRRTSTVNTLVASFLMARSEALKRGQRVSICKTNSGANCNGGASWSNGWLVFTDGDTQLSVDGTDQVLLYQQPGAETDITLTSTVTGMSFNTRGSLTFNGATFLICDTDASAVTGREVILNRSGRSRIEEDDIDGDPNKDC